MNFFTTSNNGHRPCWWQFDVGGLRVVFKQENSDGFFVLSRKYLISRLKFWLLFRNSPMRYRLVMNRQEVTFTYLCLSSSSELILFLNCGSSFCSSSLTFSLSLTWASRPPPFLKWNVLASPLCITSWSCTFSLVSGEIFCTVKQRKNLVTNNCWHYQYVCDNECAVYNDRPCNPFFRWFNSFTGVAISRNNGLNPLSQAL